MTRSTDSRRARNSASVMIGGRRRPASRPSRRRCFLASSRVEPLSERASPSSPRSLAAPLVLLARVLLRGSRTRTTVLGGSSGAGSTPSSPVPRRGDAGAAGCRPRRSPRTPPRPGRRADVRSSSSVSPRLTAPGRSGPRRRTCRGCGGHGHRGGGDGRRLSPAALSSSSSLVAQPRPPSTSEAAAAVARWLRADAGVSPPRRAPGTARRAAGGGGGLAARRPPRRWWRARPRLGSPSSCRVAR